MAFLESGLLKLMSKILRVVHFKNNLRDNQDRVRIKRIVIAKCNLFFHYCDSKEILFYYFRDTKLCAKYKKNT